MGVTVLHQYPVPGNSTGPQVIQILSKRILQLGAKPCGQFLVDCETYISLPHASSKNTVHVLHNSETPATVFSILETGTRTLYTVSDLLFNIIVEKLAGNHSKKQMKMVSQGPRFELGDFCIKLGSVTMNQTFKGILIEVEYWPGSVPRNVWNLMKEFLQEILESRAPEQPPAHLLDHWDEVYQPIRTMYQYVENFGDLRKAVGL